MIAAFKSRRPKHQLAPQPTPAPVRPSPEDRLVLQHFNFTEAQWANMSPLAKVDHREEFFWAQGMAA
jgi:hypothetical protein